MNEGYYGNTSPDFLEAGQVDPTTGLPPNWHIGSDGRVVILDVIGDDVPETTPQPETPTAQEELKPTPYEAFAAHVAEVKAGGDPLDKVSPGLRIRKGLLWSAVPSVAIAEITAISPGVGITIGVAAVGATVTGKISNAPKARGRGWDHLRKTNHVAQEATGQYYELYKPVGSTAEETDSGKPNDLELVWYRPQVVGDKTNMYAELAAMAKMAKDQGIQTMHVSKWAGQQLRKIHDFQMPENAPKASVHHAKDIPRQTKKLRVSTSTEHEFTATFTPDEWLDIARQAKQPQTDTVEVFTELALKLASIRSEHPLVKVVINNRDTPSILKEKLQQLAGGAVNERLRDIECYINPDIPQARKQGLPAPDGASKKLYFVEEGRVRDGKVANWKTRFGSQERSIPSSLDLTEEQFKELLRIPHSNPGKAAEALEAALYMAAHDQPLPKDILPVSSKEDKKVRLDAAIPAPGLQEQLLNNRNNRANFLPQRVAHGLTLGIIAASAAVGYYQLHDTLDDARANAITSAQRQIAKERHTTPEAIDPKIAAEVVDDKYPLMAGWGVVSDTEDSVKTWASDMFSKLKSSGGGNGGEDAQEDAASTSQSASEVGNSPLGEGDYDAQYKISVTGNASADGYWAASTSPELNLTLDQHQENLRMVWSQVDEVADIEDINTYPDKAWKNLIQVERKLSKDDSTTLFDRPEGDESTIPEKGQYEAVNIPVLEGTKPFGANLGGEPVKLITKEDNTYAIETGKADANYLTYWLMPDDKAPKPKYTEMTKLDYGIGVPQSEPANAMLFYIGKETGQREVEFREGELGDLMSNHITGSWDYDRNPFTDKQQEKWKGFDGFVRDALNEEDANCNVANTLATFADPYHRNGVFGFLNGSGEGSTELTGSEYHMWNTVDDATPHLRSGTGTRAAASNNSETTIAALQISGISLAGLGLAGAGLKYGDKFSFAYAQRRRRKLLEGATSQQVAIGQAASEALAYSVHGTISEASTKNRAAQLAAASPSQDGNLFIEKPHFAVEQTTEAIGQAIAGLPTGSEFGKSLKQSAKVMVAARNFSAAAGRGPRLQHETKTLLAKAKAKITKLGITRKR